MRLGSEERTNCNTRWAKRVNKKTKADSVRGHSKENAYFRLRKKLHKEGGREGKGQFPPATVTTQAAVWPKQKLFCIPSWRERVKGREFPGYRCPGTRRIWRKSEAMKTNIMLGARKSAIKRRKSKREWTPCASNLENKMTGERGSS